MDLQNSQHSLNYLLNTCQSLHTELRPCYDLFIGDVVHDQPLALFKIMASVCHRNMHGMQTVGASTGARLDLELSHVKVMS